MPAHSVVLPSEQLAYVRFSGLVTLREMVEDWTRLSREDGFDPRFDSLCDTRSATDFDCGFNGLHFIHSSFSGMARAEGVERVRLCLLLDGEDALGYARQYQSVAEVYGVVDCTIAFGLDEAAAWFGRGTKEMAALIETANRSLPAVPEVTAGK